MKAYEKITERIIKALESGTVPWRRPWKANSQWPRNLKSKKAYRGVNVWSLMLAGYASPWWVTFKQAKALGGQVRKGEHGSIVVFWKMLRKEEETDDGETKVKRIPLLRFYYVFNVEQCEGLEEKIPTPDEPVTPVDPIEAGEAIVEGYKDCPQIRFGFDRAAYAPLMDEVLMPVRDAFVSSEAYYSTLFHELTHSTGHSKRLGRGLDKKHAAFGDEDYSQEELVAEMGAAFLLGEAGIESPEQEEQNAAYIAGWLEKLREDNRLVVMAAAQAQKSTDYILGRSWDDQDD